MACEPREQFKRVAGKNGASFVGLQLRTRFDFTAAGDGEIAAKIRIVGAEEHLPPADHRSKHAQIRGITFREGGIR